MEKNPNFPVSLNSKMPALGVTTSQVVADNLNAIHAVRQAFIQNESRKKIQLVLTHHFRTSGCDAYTTWWCTKEKMVKQYFNVLNLENDFVKDIDWQTIKEWRSLSGPEDIFLKNIGNDAVLGAKIYEIKNGKEMFSNQYNILANRQYHLDQLEW